jgi:class 3 adenylate cyclase
LWGNSVNVASRLSSEATSGGILVDVLTYRRLRTLYEFEGPEPLTVKGLRQLTAYRLISKLPQEAAEHAEVA